MLNVLHVKKASKLSKDLKLEVVASVMVSLKIFNTKIKDEVNRGRGVANEMHDAPRRIRGAPVQYVSTRKDSQGRKFVL